MALDQLTRAVEAGDGHVLADRLGMLDLKDCCPKTFPDVARLLPHAARWMGDAAWGDMLTEYLQAMASIGQSDWDKAYKHISAGYLKLLSIFTTEDETSWMMPLVHQTTFDIRVIAGLADEADQSSGMQHLRDCSEKLSKGFSACWNDRTDIRSVESKRRGVVYLVNNCLKTYFRLGTLRLCKNLIKPLEMPMGGRPAMITSDFIPKSELVTYKFYVGRLNVLEDKYAEAEECLEYALTHCPVDAMVNKRKILTYLVPIKLCKGALPSHALLKKYNLVEFIAMNEAVRSGNVKAFNDALLQFQELFIRQGTYLVLEKAKALVHRNLIKHMDQVDPNKKPEQVDLVKVKEVFDWLGEPLELDEIECIIANLIFRGLIRGYISHSKRTLVLSKKNAFPFDAIKRWD